MLSLLTTVEGLSGLTQSRKPSLPAKGDFPANAVGHCSVGLSLVGRRTSGGLGVGCGTGQPGSQGQHGDMALLAKKVHLGAVRGPCVREQSWGCSSASASPSLLLWPSQGNAPGTRSPGQQGCPQGLCCHPAWSSPRPQGWFVSP